VQPQVDNILNTRERWGAERRGEGEKKRREGEEWRKWEKGKEKRECSIFYHSTQVMIDTIETSITESGGTCSSTFVLSNISPNISCSTRKIAEILVLRRFNIYYINKTNKKLIQKYTRK
jgi:hypothetical protein